MPHDNITIECFTVGPFATNLLVVRSSQSGKAMIIDPGIDCEPAYDFVQGEGLTVECIVNTHGHLDHVYGNHYMKAATGAPLLIHQADEPLLEQIPAQAISFGLPSPQVAKPDILLKDGGVVNLGGVEFEVIHTPGHTPGGICLHRDGMILVGDTLFADSIGRTDLPGGSYPQLISSIQQRLLCLTDDTVVYCGHGPTTTIGQERRFNPFLTEPNKWA